MNGCAPEFALWSFVDLGYLTYYTAYSSPPAQIKAEDGAKFNAGRMGDYTDREGPDPRRGPARPDGPVLDLQRRQHRRKRSAGHHGRGRRGAGHDGSAAARRAAPATTGG